MECEGARGRPSLEGVIAVLGDMGKHELLAAVFWGSRVYGTCRPTSDWDVMVIVGDKVAGRYGTTEELHGRVASMTAKEAVQVKSHARTRGEVLVAQWGEVTVLPREQWLRMLLEHRCEALEVLFAPPQHVLLPLAIRCSPFALDLRMLLAAAEWEAGRTLARAKRKLKEGDAKKGAKELFHSLRYLCFATQIAQHGRILDYAGCNDTWHTIANSQEPIEVDRDWLPRYKVDFRAMRAAAGNLGQLSSAFDAGKSLRLKLAADLVFHEGDFDATAALRWLRNVGVAELEECGVTGYESGGYLVLSAYALRTKLVADYAPHLYAIASELMVLVCRKEDSVVRLVKCSSEPRVALEEGGFATPFALNAMPEMLSNPLQSPLAACAILSMEGGEVVDGAPQSEPLWLASNHMFIYLRAAPVLESAVDCFALMKRHWPFVKEKFDFTALFERVENVADTVRGTGSKAALGGDNQSISGLIAARMISHERMIIEMVRTRSARAIHALTMC